MRPQNQVFGEGGGHFLKTGLSINFYLTVVVSLNFLKDLPNKPGNSFLNILP